MKNIKIRDAPEPVAGLQKILGSAMRAYAGESVLENKK